MVLRPLALACLVLALAACKPSAPAAPASPPAEAGAPANDAVASIAPLSSPEQEVKASMYKLLEMKTYHAVMSTGGTGTDNEVDFVAPDRFRISTPAGSQVIVGDTMYLQTGAGTMKVPLPAGTLSQFRDPLKIEQNRTGMSVESLGKDNIEGQAAKKYLVRHTLPKPGEFTYWIGDNGLPLQMVHSGEAQGKAYTMTMRYSRFDDPTIAIEPPQ